MKFEFVRKTPGYKFSLFWGQSGEFTFYIGTHTHPWGKFYFFRNVETQIIVEKKTWVLFDPQVNDFLANSDDLINDDHSWYSSLPMFSTEEMANAYMGEIYNKEGNIELTANKKISTAKFVARRAIVTIKVWKDELNYNSQHK